MTDGASAASGARLKLTRSYPVATEAGLVKEHVLEVAIHGRGVRASLTVAAVHYYVDGVQVDREDFDVLSRWLPSWRTEDR